MNTQLNKIDKKEDLPIFVKWMEFLKWFLPVLEKFPKRTRFTITNRMENISLDILELLIEARYSKDKRTSLKKVNLYLEKIRILFRLSHETKLVSTKTYNHASKSINEVGMMLGGWLRQQGRR